ncbi:DUF4825 domain-containing protein [Sporosarcina sp. P37]|uniref:DUF4825 domain-containing protein n=1 Tax=unclassified Sporosarcina TaxID=2647733 RepID=UPI0009C048F8|nr:MULTISPECIES: DUF4825 domain-containing protein [unclassified Sporosarcina]ARD46981.1 hypothetical protein SporoP33_01135 [Sporosarcina sp. P33]ARK23506.1 DUF4825 domain-containing protein [Sporosarcina sp. P37]PID17661.1 DUF4825 domain-containing protein [Sporosarcina sp. P35]
MKQITALLSFLLLAILFISGCNTRSADEDVFIFKGSYVGDNSAVGNIVNHLRFAGHFKEFELKTKEEPYGIVLNYDEAETEQHNKETAIYNATFLFALIQNADWIICNFDGEEYKITKEDLQSWYGEDFSAFESEDELKTFIQKHLDDKDKLNQIFV